MSALTSLRHQTDNLGTSCGNPRPREQYDCHRTPIVRQVTLSRGFSRTYMDFCNRSKYCDKSVDCLQFVRSATCQYARALKLCTNLKANAISSLGFRFP